MQHDSTKEHAMAHGINTLVLHLHQNVLPPFLPFAPQVRSNGSMRKKMPSRPANGLDMLAAAADHDRFAASRDDVHVNSSSRTQEGPCAPARLQQHPPALLQEDRWPRSPQQALSTAMLDAQQNVPLLTYLLTILLAATVQKNQLSRRAIELLKASETS